jgi:hypothetical protein
MSIHGKINATSEAIASGNKQYPTAHSDGKNPTVPPIKSTFTVATPPPKVTIEKTPVKSTVA